MKYPPVLLDGNQARAVGRGFARAVSESGYGIHACSILDDHVHLVIAPSSRTFEQIVRHLRGRASMQLKIEGMHPLAEYQKSDGSCPSIWSEGFWKVFCFDEEHVENAIRYVEKNPIRESKRAQTWSCVRPYPYSA